MPPKGRSSSSHSSRSSHSSPRSSGRSSSSRSSSSRSSSHSSGSRSSWSGSTSGPSRHSSTSHAGRPVLPGRSGRSTTSRTSVPRRPRYNQPTGFRGSGTAPTYYYGRNHDYIFFPLAWTDESTGTSYESGYYDENGQYYPTVSFEKNGRYENVVCHCTYCDQDTLMNPAADEVAARNLHCPNCGAPLEIRSELDTYRGPSAAAAFSAQPRRKKRRWIVPLVIVLVLAGLYAYGSRLLKEQENQPGTQQEEFRITETSAASDTDLFGDTIRLASSGDRIYTVSSTSADKILVWDEDAESYYDESTECWIWYNTDVEPAVWQYWYEGISSDFGDYGWMEHDADGWFIERSYGNWIPLPDRYDTGRLWSIGE